MKKYIMAFFISLILLLLLMTIYVTTSSIRHGPLTSSEFNQIKTAAENKNLEVLQDNLLKTPSLSGKLIIMKYLEDIGSEDSVPVLIEMLSYDLYWWDKLDSELKITTAEIRYSAFQILSTYGNEIESELKGIVNKTEGYKKIYVSALLYKLGHDKYKNHIDDIDDKRYSDDINFIKRDIFNQYQ